MKKAFLIFIWFALTANLWAQVVQSGQVFELNSGNTPIAGVEILVFGALPADSDNAGKFTLRFSKAQSGDPLIINKIYKKDYELVNETEIKNRVVSSSTPLKIVLCKTGALEAARRKYYNIGQDRYYARYLEANEKLKEEKSKSALSQKDYELKLEEIAEEYKSAMDRLDYYADKFARINRDDLNELDAKAMTLMDEGKVEEAIKTYEDAEIVKKFQEKVSTRDTALHNIEILNNALWNELSLLLDKNDSLSLTKADTIYAHLIQSDSENYRYNYDYANFLMTQKRNSEAFPFLKKALLSAAGEKDEREVRSLLDQFFSEISDETLLKDYQTELRQADSILKEREELEGLKKFLKD